MSLKAATALLFLPLFLTLTSARAEGTHSLSLASSPTPQELAQTLWENSPRLQHYRIRLAEVRGEQHRTHLLPNPTLDLSWNTIPIGTTNPTDLDKPFARVPNYAFEVSQLLEIGKRGPRQRAAASLTSAMQEEARAGLYDVYFDLVERIASVAIAEIRIASLSELADDAKQLTELQRARAQKGDAALLDVDRSALEEEKLWTALAEERQKLTVALRECSQIVGSSCLPFGSYDAARQYLERELGNAKDLEQRPDLRSLEYQSAAASHALELARARAIPDPTVRVGYVHDRFLVSGNHRNSLFVGVSLPLTFFDYGQADSRVAEATQVAAARTRTLLMDQTKGQLTALGEQRDKLEQRRQRMRESTLPLAQSVVDRLQEVVRRGGASLPDLLLARRTLGELITDAAELDLFAFQLTLTEARLKGNGPPTPAALQQTP